MSSEHEATSIVYSDFGSPSKVISIRKQVISNPKANEVQIKVLAAPIHPVDILTIKNLYPIVPTELPAIGGCECVGDITRTGENVKNLKPNDRVIIPFPAPTNTGTWTTLGNYPVENVMSFPSNIPISEAATFSLNPMTAYAMLKEFVHLEAGDTVIQNAANSAVGQVVHQLCKKMGINSIGIIRKRSDAKQHKELCEYLKSIGASEVITPEELKSTDIFESKFKKPKLALNAVGGKTTELMSDYLQKKGVLVTYGALTENFVQGESFRFIVNDISFRGFWIDDWLKQPENKNKKTQMYAELLSMVAAGELKAPVHEMIKIENFKVALNSTMKSYSGKKIIFDFEN